jgi:tetratricopeptide (TPR) repeat protein
MSANLRLDCAPKPFWKSPAEGNRPASRYLLLFILGIALAVRLIHFFTIEPQPFLKFPLAASQTDMYAFWQWAQSIAGGDWWGRDTYHPYFGWMKDLAPLESWYARWGGKEIFHQAPLYPYFLAVLIALKLSLPTIIALQLVLGSLQVLIIFSVTRRLFDDRVGLVAAGLTALYGPFTFYQGLLLRDWLPPILEPLILLMVLRARALPRPGRWLAAGLTMGIAILTKETAFVLVMAVSVWLIIELRRSPRHLGPAFGLLAAGIAVCLFPLVVRNLAVGAPPFAISKQGPGAIIYSLSADARAVGFAPVRQLEERRARAAGKSWAALQEALSTYEGDYRGLLRHELRKLEGVIDPFEFPNNESYDYGRELSPILDWTANYAAVFPLGVTGLLLLLRDRHRPSLLYWYVGSSVAALLLTVILARFRLGLVPGLIIAGAYAVKYFATAIRDKSLARLGTAGALLLAVSAVQQLWAPAGWSHESVHALSYFVSAEIDAADRRFDRAIEQVRNFQQKLNRLPETRELTSVREGLTNEFLMREAHYHLEWSSDLLEQHQEQEARDHLRIAESLYAKSPLQPLGLYNLGLMSLRLHEKEKAGLFFRQYLNLEPQGVRADHVRNILALLPD